MNEDQQRVLLLLAANIRKRRLASGLTQAQLAERLSVETRFVQSLEAAADAPGFGTLVRLATTLGVEVRDLFAEAEPAARNPGRPPKKPR